MARIEPVLIIEVIDGDEVRECRGASVGVDIRHEQIAVRNEREVPAIGTPRGIRLALDLAAGRQGAQLHPRHVVTGIGDGRHLDPRQAILRVRRPCNPMPIRRYGARLVVHRAIVRVVRVARCDRLELREDWGIGDDKIVKQHIRSDVAELDKVGIRVERHGDVHGSKQMVAVAVVLTAEDDGDRIGAEHNGRVDGRAGRADSIDLPKDERSAGSGGRGRYRERVGLLDVRTQSIRSDRSGQHEPWPSRNVVSDGAGI